MRQSLFRFVNLAGVVEAIGRYTFDSTNLLIVARMSWWPDTSSRVSGRYFSTLGMILVTIKSQFFRNNTMVDCLLPQQASSQRFFSLSHWYCQN